MSTEQRQTITRLVRKLSMARTRALLTETEREHLRSEKASSNQYQAVSRIRNRIHEELQTDLEVLEKHHPELYKELAQVVCDSEE
jgi:hypothetical protein